MTQQDAAVATAPADAEATTQAIADNTEAQAEEARTREAATELFKAISDHADQTDPGDPSGRERDSHGRFVGPAESEDQPASAAGDAAEAPGEPPKLDSPWVQAAHDVYFTNAEIDTFPNDSVLRAAVIGRRVELSHRHRSENHPPAEAPPEPQVQPTGPTPQNEPAGEAPPAFDLKLDEEELGKEVTGPLKAMAAQLGKMQETLTAQNAELRQKVERLEGAAQQGAEVAREVQASRDAQAWDGIVTAHPEILKAIGTPSQAYANPGSAQHRNWKMLTPIIADVAQRYRAAVGDNGMTPEVWSRITKDAFEESGLARIAGSASSNGVHQPPGTVVTGDAARRSAPPSRSAEGEDEFDRITNVMKLEWDHSGGNPFRE